jgi:nitrous oxide reductase accessory protein NosL
MAWLSPEGLGSECIGAVGRKEAASFSEEKKQKHFHSLKFGRSMNE